MISRRNVMAGLGAAAVLPMPALGAEPRVLRARMMLDEGRALVAVGMNGQGPYVFMIDTGGVVSLVNDDLAKQLKLPIIGHSALGGAGGHGIYPLYKARDFLIGGTMRQSQVALVGAGSFDYGRDVQGTLAAGILTASDSELDFDAGELRLYPDGRGERTGFTRIDSSIRRVNDRGDGSAYIFARGVIDGHNLEFLLDTGAPGAPILFPDAARRIGLWDDGKPYAPTRPRGVGGIGELGRFVRAGRLDFAGLMMERPLVQLRGRQSGRPALGDGIIGLPLLRRLNLSIDAGRRSLWVQPNRQPAAPETYGLAGIWVDPHGDDFVVAAVGTGSPAAKAGIVAGDRLIPSDPRTPFRDFSGPPGSTRTVTIEHGGQRRSVTLALEDYL